MKILRKNGWKFCVSCSPYVRTIIFSSNVYVNGDTASAEDEAVKPFLSYVKILIDDDGYDKYQILNFDGTGFYWKKMPPNGLQIGSKSWSSLAKDVGVWMTVTPSKAVNGDLTGLFKIKITYCFC